MDVVAATVAGVFDLDGRARHDGRVAHVAREGEAWWAVTPAGLVRNGGLVAPPPPDATLTCVAPTAAKIWAGGDSARLFVLEDGLLVESESFAEAPGRDSWHTPWGGPPDVRSLSVGADGTLYVNVHVGGILRQDGDTFSPTVDIHSDVHQVVAHPHRAGVVVAATARGLAVDAGGDGFAFRTGGLAHTYCRAVAVDGDTVVVSASRGPSGGGARLYVGSLEGGDLRPCDELGMFDGQLDTHCVLARDGSILVGNGPTAWASTDDGATWEAVVDGLPTITALA